MTSWLPLFLFVILFGLSMDYHVFILSRIREAVDGGMSTDRAVAHGIKQTAGVVTSAAVVMVAVFAIFATLSSLEFKQMGVGLAAAILIDATDRARGAAARDDEAPGRLELVPAAQAELAPAARPRARAGAGEGVAKPLGTLPPHARACGGRRPPRPAPRRLRRGALQGGAGQARATRSASASTTRSPSSRSRRTPPTSRRSPRRPSRSPTRRSRTWRRSSRPDELEKDFDAFVASLKKQRDLTKQIGDAAGKGDTVKIQQIATEAQKAQAEYRKLSDKIGFKECGGRT